jgi:flagellar hook-associated protein 3 FlgL
MMSNEVLYNLTNSLDSYTNAETVESTGKSINEASDNPNGAATAIDLQSSISQLNTMTANSSTVKSQLEETSSVLSDVSTQLTNLRTLVVEAANSATTSSETSSILAQLDEIKQQLLSDGNTKYNGSYLLSGSETENAPLTASTSGDAPYSYQGNTNTHSVTVAPGVKIASNVTADQVFNIGGVADSSTSDVFTIIQNLESNIQAGNTTAISASLTGIDANISNVTTIEAEVGARTDQVESLATQVSSTLTNLTTSLSNTEDANMATAAVNVQETENVYEAAIAVAQKVFSLSLASYFQ